MKELAITLDTEKKQPLYEQIYEALREAILQGRILQGEKLPSTLPVKSAFFHGRSSYNLYGLYLYASVRRIETKLNVL